MVLSYALVARTIPPQGPVVLVDFAQKEGNFQSVARQLLEKLGSSDQKKSFTADSYVFHVLVQGGLTVICMADSGDGHRIPYSFMTDVRSRFLASHGASWDTAGEQGMAVFRRVLQERMEYYNTDPGADKIKRVRGEVDAVKDVMLKNIEKVVERGESIETLVEKTNSLETESLVFKSSSNKLKRKLWCKNAKLCVCLIIMAVVVVAGAAGIIVWQVTKPGAVHATTIVRATTTTTTPPPHHTTNPIVVPTSPGHAGATTSAIEYSTLQGTTVPIAATSTGAVDPTSSIIATSSAVATTNPASSAAPTSPASSVVPTSAASSSVVPTSLDASTASQSTSSAEATVLASSTEVATSTAPLS